MSSIPLWVLLTIGVLGRPIWAGDRNRTQVKDDFSTDFAKTIIKRAKAAEISSIMNTKVDPCDDFYRYSCGNWHRSNPAQLFRDIMTDKFQMISKGFDRKVELFLTEPKLESANELEDKVKDFYKACRSVRDYKLRYKAALESVYKEYGQLPFLLTDEEWQEETNEFSWWRTVAQIQNKYGKQILLAVDIMGDIRNNNDSMVYIGPPDYQLSHTNSKLMTLLQEVQTRAYLEVYFDLKEEAAEKLSELMSKFERSLVRGVTDARLGKGIEELLTLHNVSELRATYNESFDVQEFLEIVLNTKELPETVYVYDEKYLENLVKKVADQKKSTLASYILWQLLQEYFVDSDEEDLGKWCVEKTKKFFGKYMDHAVYQRYRSDQSEQEVYQVWEELRAAFREELTGDKLDWIANATREYAVEKLNAMRLSINSYDDENFTDVYGDIHIDRTNYVLNVQNVLIQESRRHVEKLHKPRPDIEATEVLSFTPAYNLLENSIRIPVALLQPRFLWDINYPQAVKYATLGYLIAHEIVHGFDDDGRKYDKDGNALEWWDAKSTYEFEARRKCFQAQYHSYRYGGRKLPESVLQSENIADNAAVKLAYAAYMRWLRTQKVSEPDIEDRERLPGLQFDNRRLFFINFAQVWCEDVQTLFRSSVASSDTHAPGMYRVIGSLSNFQEFSWVFQCKPDAPMDPEFKCSIY